ncbi:hypothetical protein [Luethyella okanaganae]|uniref:Uncharacterized protein n=1 Tax=Luethyella okanaganae TaxID=69372 RepID=A0ABW1VHZ6_9MICO
MKLKTIVATAATISLLLAAGTAAASAAEPPSATDSAMSALGNLGLVGFDSQSRTAFASASGSGTLSASSGLTVDGRDTAVSIKPVTEAKPVEISGALVYGVSEVYSYALTGAGAAANAGYVILNDVSAPSSHQFEITANGKPATLSLVDGRVTVGDETGTVINSIAPAWAKDANGKNLSSSYSVNGNVLTQTVVHGDDTAYPIVADPGLECDWAFCTVLMTRSETQQMASSMAAAGALVAAACGPAAWACGIGIALMVDTANQAANQGKCAGIRKQTIAAPVWPVIEPCRS